MKELEAAYSNVELALADEIIDLIAAHGVPTSVGAAYELADLLYPFIVDLRADLYRREVEAIVAAHGALTVAKPLFYDLSAARRLVANCAGLGQFDNNVRVDLLDPKSQQVVKMSVAPYLMPDVEDVQLAMVKRLTGGAARHAKQASRDTVWRTADENNMRWARRLTGKENCPFCAMLASRGAVYTKQHVLTGGDGRKYHDHCDCTAVLVPDPKRWDGKDEADRLYSMWREAGSLNKFGQIFKEQGAFSGFSAA